MQIIHSKSLKDLNTFGVEARAKKYLELHTLDEVRCFIREVYPEEETVLFLGGGSNLLFTADYPGMVVAIRNKGISVQAGMGGEVLVTAQAGERWDDLVDYCVDQGYWGIENLSMIPGNAGSAPIQNIGAYGVEIQDVIEHVDGIHLPGGHAERLGREACRFAYRDSLFKTELKGRFLITAITLRLQLLGLPNLTYKALQQACLCAGKPEPKLREVRDLVRAIRSSKLPDPSDLGNAGSFFKNPSITAEAWQRLSQVYPEMPAYRQQDGTYKLAAGWLIERCGWKGKRIGDAGVHDKQALVLVNHGKATGAEIKSLAGSIQESVYQMFDIHLEPEVNIL